MKKQYTSEEKKAYFENQKSEIERKLVEGVKKCYTEGNFKHYLDTVSKFRNYSLNNCLLIALQRPDATYVAGFTDWKTKFHRTVKKGEKGIKILAPAPHKYTTEVVDEDGNRASKEISYIRYRMVSVFDISQTEGDKLPEICKRLDSDVDDFEGLVKRISDIAGIPVFFEDIPSDVNGYYHNKEKKIVVQTGMPQAQTIKTLIHEIAHSILHGEGCKLSKAVKEIQAESVAYMVCNELGIDTAEYSFEYVASWAQQDMKTLNDQMQVVRTTADEIVGSIRKDASFFMVIHRKIGCLSRKLSRANENPLYIADFSVFSNAL